MILSHFFHQGLIHILRSSFGPILCESLQTVFGITRLVTVIEEQATAGGFGGGGFIAPGVVEVGAKFEGQAVVFGVESVGYVIAGLILRWPGGVVGRHIKSALAFPFLNLQRVTWRVGVGAPVFLESIDRIDRRSIRAGGLEGDIHGFAPTFTIIGVGAVPYLAQGYLLLTSRGT